MNFLRCIGLSVIVLLSACDAQAPPAPKPKVVAEAVAKASPVESKVSGKPADPEASAPAKAPVHELKPNVTVVPVTAKSEGAAPAAKSTSPADAKGPASSQKPAASKREQASKKSVAESKKVLKETSLGNAKLDLSLPPELAKELQPPGATAKAKPRKPLLPPMFGDKSGSSSDEPFEVNGRILSNEMQLQMRNENRRDVEGAALDFKFRQ